ncbi:hypothetical protein EBZ38_13965 [bacterium]|nr:hypothetical protein [bacterium]
MSPAQKSDVLSEAAKAAPPIAITTAVTIGGLTLNEWVAIATLLYVVLQSGWLIWKWYHAIKERKDKVSEES